VLVRWPKDPKTKSYMDEDTSLFCSMVVVSSRMYVEYIFLGLNLVHRSRGVSWSTMMGQSSLQFPLQDYPLSGGKARVNMKGDLYSLKKKNKKKKKKKKRKGKKLLPVAKFQLPTFGAVFYE
jgi:hypothetical protein